MGSHEERIKRIKSTSLLSNLRLALKLKILGKLHSDRDALFLEGYTKWGSHEERKSTLKNPLLRN